MSDNQTANTQTILDSELQLRLWALFDAAKAICEEDTPQRWVDLYRAVSNVPESQYGR